MRRGVHPGAGRDGAVLVVIVLLTLAMLALAHGLLVSAESAYTTSRAHARATELDARASGAIEAERRRGWAQWMDSLARGERRSLVDAPPGEPRTIVVWRRLDREAWTVGATSRYVDGPAVGSRRLVWILDPARRVAALPGVVSTAAGAPVTAAGPIVSDTAPSLGTVPAPALGLLDLSRLLGAADSVGPAGTPAPVEVGGACDTSEPWNWGDPSRPHRPCGGYFVVKGSRTSLVLAGGEGQGVLVVDGDLVIGSGGRLFGVVVASGRVDMVGGSRVEGRVIAFGGIGVEAGSTVVGSPAWAERALAAARGSLGGSILLHPAARLGPE